MKTMKITNLILLILLSIQSFSIDIPKHFFVTEKVTLLVTDFKVTSKTNQSIGNIEQQIVSLSPTFKFYDNNGKLVAHAKETVISLVTQIKIYDDKGNYIGKFEQKIFENLFSIQNTYAIYDKYDKRIGTSRKLDLFSTSIDIYDNNGKLIVQIKIPMINFITDKWEIKIESDIDNRLVIFIPCYKTYYDGKRK